MMHWKGPIAAIIVGTGTLCVGCGAGTQESGRDSEGASAAAEGVEFAVARFSVEGMTCGGCVLATEMAVRLVDGVRSVTAALGEDGKHGSATVEYDPARASTEAIAAAIRKAGFTPRPSESDAGRSGPSGAPPARPS